MGFYILDIKSKHSQINCTYNIKIAYFGSCSAQMFQRGA